MIAQQFQGLRCLIDRQTSASILRFDRLYRQSQFDMRSACRNLLGEIGYEARVNKSWSGSPRSILFVSHHTNVLDGFAMPLVAPERTEIQRVIFALSAFPLGREFVHRNILVYPKAAIIICFVAIQGCGIGSSTSLRIDGDRWKKA